MHKAQRRTQMVGTEEINSVATWMREGQSRMLWAPEPNPWASPPHLTHERHHSSAPPILPSLQSHLSPGCQEVIPTASNPLPPCNAHFPNPRQGTGPSYSLCIQEYAAIVEVRPVLPKEELPQRGLFLPFNPRHILWQPVGT